MATVNDLLNVVQDLVRDLGGDAPIAYTILEKDDVKTVMEYSGLDVESLTPELLEDVMTKVHDLMPSCLDIIEDVMETNKYVDPDDEDDKVYDDCPDCNCPASDCVCDPVDEEEEKEMDEMEERGYQRFKENEHSFDRDDE